VALPLPQHETRPRVAPKVRLRRPNRENESNPLLIATAIRNGFQRVKRASRWVERVEQSPGFVLLRTDAQERMIRLAMAIVHRTDRDRLSRPTRAWLAQVVGVSERTITRYIARLHHWGLLATVAPGRRGTFAPGGRNARSRPGTPIPSQNHPDDPANDAAVYVLCEPAQPREHAPDEESVDISVSPPPVRVIENPYTHARARKYPQSTPLRGADSSKRAAKRLQKEAAWRYGITWDPLVTPSSQDNRLAAAGELQNRLPALRHIRTVYVRSICKPFFDAGWTIKDLIEAIDHRPDGTRWPHSGTRGVENIPGWMKNRLRAWITHDGTIHRSPTQRRRARRAAAQARTRAMLEHQAEVRATINADPDRHNTARDRFFAWWETKKRAARRTPGQVSKPYKPTL